MDAMHAKLAKRPSHAGVAEHRQVSLKDLLFANPKLMEMVGRNLPTRPGLLAELGELLDLGHRALAQALLPHALPALVAVDNREGLEALAKQVLCRSWRCALGVAAGGGGRAYDTFC